MDDALHHPQRDLRGRSAISPTAIATTSSELVIRSGLVFRSERHIPYARIQNIDAVQNVLHRLLNVVEVEVETGGGETSEATMSVLPMAAFHEMRERVFAGSAHARRTTPAAVEPSPRRRRCSH